jgi:serine/threonine protein kinase
VDLSGYSLETLREYGEFSLHRAPSQQPEPASILLLTLASTRPTTETLEKLDHEYSLRNELATTWAFRPRDLSRYDNKTVLLHEDPGGAPLHRLIQWPMEMTRFLHLAIGLATALSTLHEQGLIHKDIKPSNVLVGSTTDQVWLTGLGLDSGLARERVVPDPPEFIALKWR